MVPLSRALESEVWELFDVSTSLGPDGLAPFLDRVLRRCRDWFNASNVSIFLSEQGRQSFRFAAGESSLKDVRFGPGDGIAGVAIQTGQSMLVNDPNDHPLLKGKVGRARKAYSSSMVVPLAAQDGTVVGVLNVSRGNGKPVFDDGDLTKAGTIAKLVALSVSNARLFVDVHGLRARLESVLQSMQTAVCVLDSEGHLTDWNLSAAQLFVLNSAMPFDRIKSANKDLTHAFVELSRAALAGEKARKKVPGLRSWSIAAVPLADGGATITLEETTEDDLAERERQRLLRLAEIGQMTAAIAHEIRNPLTGIRSAAQLIPAAPDQAEEFAGIIDEEARKLNALCEDFLDFARPLLLKARPDSLARIAQGVIARTQAEARRHGASLSLEIEAENPTIHLDAMRIEQVLRNLVLNAIQATGTGGHVLVRIDRDGFEVVDDGPGMSAEDRARLFTPFFTTKPSGTGLGLSNVRKIVDAHGARIEVTSEPGHGATFRVRFPSEEAA